MGPHSLELISFRLCPFVQRAMILLDYKNIDHKVTFVDLGDPPDWFGEISPRSKVPVLRVNGEVSIFESNVISEYLDEVTPPPLMPASPLIRAANRSWIEYSTLALMPLRDLTTVESVVALENVVSDFMTRLDVLEEAIGDGPYFNGASFSIVDATYAPLFVRLDYFDSYLTGLTPTNRFPKLATWRSTLTGMPAVRNTIGDDFQERMDELVVRRQGYLATLLPDSIKVDGPRREY